MSKKVLISLTMIILTMACVSGATAAYFSSQKVLGDNTFTMGTVDLQESKITGLPLRISNLTPGQESISNMVSVAYSGSINADLYFGLKAENDTDLREILTFAIEEFNSDNTSKGYITSYQPIENLFARYIKIASNVPKDSRRYFKVHIKVSSEANNNFIGLSAENSIIVSAVQTGQEPDGIPADYQ